MSFPIKVPFSNGRNYLFYKIGFIIFLMLILLIPTSMIESVINERAMRQEGVSQEIMSGWANEQTLSGPVLVVPYYIRHEQRDEKGKLRTYYTLSRAYFLPESLKVEGDIETHTKKRGIYEMRLYSGVFQLHGTFRHPDFSSWEEMPSQILWDKSYLLMGISDLRGVREELQVAINGEKSSFGPWMEDKKLFSSAVQSLLSEAQVKGAGSFDFDLSMKVDGSRSLQFLPLARNTSITLKSSWPHPSFFGTFLPNDNEITSHGFVAHWNIPEIARNIPKQWSLEDAQFDSGSFNSFVFGTNFMEPVQIYQFTTRSVKYAHLFILLTFVSFFMIEILNKIKVHPVQYLLVGSALCLFYILLLSLSEHFPMGSSYLISTIAIVLMLLGYLTTVLKNKRRALLLVTGIAGLYGYLFTVLKAEDYSLLMGSLGIFFALSLVMFLTRKVDWYELGTRDAAE